MNDNNITLTLNFPINMSYIYSLSNNKQKHENKKL